MPLLAGIIQTLKPLAERFDPFGDSDSCEGDGHRLVDLWNKLFRVAALGWSAIPQPKGLIEQLLDREEQVADWLKIAEGWNSFIGELLHQGRCAKGVDKLKNETVLVIMIDDVDLQVQRMQELLPALRLLYHPRVFFLVAADKSHMIDMLKLDFLGKQHDLAGHQNARSESAIEIAKTDRWASVLAESAFQKVFPKRNQWKLEWLSALEFLAFPGSVGPVRTKNAEGRTNYLPLTEDTKSQDQIVQSFRDYFKASGNATHYQDGKAALALETIAELAKKSGLRGVMPYRAAAQLWDYVIGLDEKRQPAEVLARLLSPDDRQATVLYDDNIVDLPTAGELAALYRRGPTELAGSYDLVFSSRPDFVFNAAGRASVWMSTEPETGFNFTGALIAKTLEEDGINIDASALRWETYLSLAWTEWPALRASFSWTRHVHPTPSRLLTQTHDWAQFLRAILEPEGKLETYAYAWIYYQRQWNDCGPDGAMKPIELKSKPRPADWEALLNFDNLNQNQKQLWQSTTLPLLARPELGFPPAVQKRLLDGVPSKNLEELRSNRRRGVTDAKVAAEMQRGKVLSELPKEHEIQSMIVTIDKAYQDTHGENLWSRMVEEKAGNNKFPDDSGKA
jgi:hypothetical protein